MASRSSGLIGSGIGAAVGGYFGGAAGASIGSQVGQGVGDIFGRKAQEKYDANRQIEAEVRNLWYTKKLIDYQNEYNSPKNQMKRLQEAGLNPMLVYGSGNMVGNQSGTGSAPTTAPTLSKAQSRALDISQYQSLENQGLTNELLQQQVMAQRNTNSAFEVNQAMAIANAQEQNGILKAQKRLAEANADIAEHDKNLYLKREGTTSKDSSWLARFDTWKKGLLDNRDRAYYNATHNSDGSKKPWYQFW